MRKNYRKGMGKSSGQPLQADILAVGSELLHGGRVESNSLFLAEQLAHCGLEVRQKICVGDYKKDIQDALRNSIKNVDVLVVTGGLGSTLDDCTREAIASMCGRRLIRRKVAYEDLQARYAWLGRQVTPLIAQQALLPVGSLLMRNPIGTAAGFCLRAKGAIIFALPGVSREARMMMESQVGPVLKKTWKHVPQLLSHSFNTFGLSEIEVQRLMEPVLDTRFFGHPVQFGLLASPLGVKVTVNCWLPSQSQVRRAKKQASQNWEKFLDHVRGCVASQVFSEGDQTMEQVVGGQLTQRAWTIGLAESCTGGLTTHRLTQVPGSSRYVDRAVVTYSNQAKQEMLHVPESILKKYGAVSHHVAKAMAIGIRQQSSVDLGLAITGIAGPGGGSKKKPVGLVYLALDGPLGNQVQRCRFWGNRSEVQLRASQAALNLVRRYIDASDS